MKIYSPATVLGIRALQLDGFTGKILRHTVRIRNTFGMGDNVRNDMYISVDASTVSVEDAGDFKAFHVQVPQGWAAERIGAELTGSGAGRLGPDGPEIWPDWVISTVAGDRQWCTEFTAMVAYAKTKGWVTEDSTIKAHIEYR